MQSSALQEFPKCQVKGSQSTGQADRVAAKPVEAALLTGGTDRHYAYGLALSLVEEGVCLEVVGGSRVDGPEMHSTPGLKFLNLWKRRGCGAGVLMNGKRLLAYYVRLIAYAWKARPGIFHILWNNRIEWFDRTLLMLYYRMLGKKVVLTAHNVNMAKRDRRDSAWNRLTLKIQYRLCDQIFVHTKKMKDELIKDFGVPAKAVTVVPYGINNAVPPARLTPAEAKHRLGISRFEKTILFFGNMRPSKGLHDLLAAFEELLEKDTRYRLIVAGQLIRSYKGYWERTRQALRRVEESRNVIVRAEYIPDQDIPLYFTAADVLALPYTEIFQSGVLFLGYSFGLPVVATDVGELKKDIVEGRTGFLCSPHDPAGLAAAIEKYFESDLFREMDSRRQDIRDYAAARHSWSKVSAITHAVYRELSGENPRHETADCENRGDNLLSA